QAEDGIRDATVTGVQTCALPICDYLPVCHLYLHVFLNRLDSDFLQHVAVDPRKLAPRVHQNSSNHSRSARSFMIFYFAPNMKKRSEERRVGKEYRMMWCSDKIKK